MKKHLLVITILGIITSSQLLAEGIHLRSGKIASERVAYQLVKQFDVDDTNALNKLELSEAIAYLDEARPLFNHRLDYTASHEIPSAPPKIAYGLVEGFDGDGDYQLTEEELTLAFTYLRRLNVAGSSLLAVAR